MDSNIYKEFEKTGVVCPELLKEFDQHGKWLGQPKNRVSVSSKITSSLSKGYTSTISMSSTPKPRGGTAIPIDPKVADHLSELKLKDDAIQYKDKDGHLHLLTSFVCPNIGNEVNGEEIIPYKTIAGKLEKRHGISLKAPNLKSCGTIDIMNCANIEFDELEHVSGNLQTSHPNRVSIFAPKLSKVDGSLLLDDLDKIDLPSLHTIGGRIFCGAANNGFRMKLKNITSYPDIACLSNKDHSELIRGLSIQSLNKILNNKKIKYYDEPKKILTLINKELLKRQILEKINTDERSIEI